MLLLLLQPDNTLKYQAKVFSFLLQLGATWKFYIEKEEDESNI